MPCRNPKKNWRTGITGQVIQTSAPRDPARRKVITKKDGKYMAWYWGKKVGTHKTRANAIKTLRKY